MENSGAQPIAASASPRALHYQTHLDRVSRSFAFCIARLDGVLRERIGLSYLLCRLLDTIEDADWPGADAQDSSFKSFEAFLLHRPDTATVEAWASAFPAGLPEGEVILLADAASLIEDFHSWPDENRLPLGRLVLSMSGGMRHYMARKARLGRLVLINGADVNRYCFFVAGVVGEMLARFTTMQASKTSLKDAFRFGLFLQKVNLLKDQLGDEKSGRFLVPSRVQVLKSLLKDADGAFRFLRSLPDKQVGFRLFCAWSLFLGLASLPWIQQSVRMGDMSKIPREEAMSLMAVIESQIDDAESLASMYEALKAAAVEEVRVATGGAPAGDVRDVALEAEAGQLLALYRGELPDQDVLRLFRGEEID